MTDYADFNVDPRAFLGGFIEVDPEFAEEPTIDAEALKAAMRTLASGVAMVTTQVEGRPWGLTLSACISISASPAHVLISLSHSASARSAILKSQRFGLSILRADQKDLAELGAVPSGPKYVDAFLEKRGPEVEMTMIAGALYHLDCRIERVFEVSDHTLIIGTVETAIPGTGSVDPSREPLLYFDRMFHELGARV